MTLKLKKPYSLDYSIERDIDRMHAVEDILDKLERNPSPLELEQMGSYILYGKDENGLNAYQRGEMLADRRYTSYRTKEDENISLDALLESPLADQQQFKPVSHRNRNICARTIINRPKYDKKGNLLDIGDADIPGMEELWRCIDKLDHWIAVLEGRVAPNPTDILFDDSYRLYRLKHTLIDLRRHQYYLKDSYKPTIHFLAVAHPHAQYINWSSDAAYWLSYSAWENKVNNTYYPNVSKNIADYETRIDEKSGDLEVKWIIRKHIFNWEDPTHIKMLMRYYWNLHELFHDKLDTDGNTLLLDFQRYRRMAALPRIADLVLELRLHQMNCDEIIEYMRDYYGIQCAKHQVFTLIGSYIPRTIALTATKHRLLLTTPPNHRKFCRECGKFLPCEPVFFSRDNSRADKLALRCKTCDKKIRKARSLAKQNG